MKEKIFEPALVDEKLLQKLRQDPSLRAAYGAAPAGYSRLMAPRFDMERVWKLMDGAIPLMGSDLFNSMNFKEIYPNRRHFPALNHHF